MKKAGTVTFRSVIEQTEKYTTSTIETTLIITKATRILSNFTITNPQTYSLNKTITASIPTLTPNIGEIIYSSSNTNIATINSNGIIKIINTGTVTFTATVNADDQYSSTQITAILEIIKSDPLISWSILTNGNTIEYSPNLLSSQQVTKPIDHTGNIIYFSLHEDIATINTTGVISMKKAGTVTFRAVIEQTEKYNVSTIETTLIITKATRTLSNFIMSTQQLYTPIPFTPILPKLSAGNDNIIYESSDPYTALIYSSGLIAMKKPGIVTFSAKVNETEQYFSADTTFTLAIVYSGTQTGGDPIIITINGEQFALAKHIDYVNLLADYENKVFINGYVDMLKITDFPKQIYWDGELADTVNLKHIYDNTYYRKFYIEYLNEKIEIDADTLDIKYITSVNKIKIISFIPKRGIKSITFNKIYPLTNMTKGLKIGFNSYIITIISDLNTDDRHHLELFNVKPINNITTCGALVSVDKIIKISNLEGSELKNYNLSPFS